MVTDTIPAGPGWDDPGEVDPCEVCGCWSDDDECALDPAEGTCHCHVDEPADWQFTAAHRRQTLNRVKEQA